MALVASWRFLSARSSARLRREARGLLRYDSRVGLGRRKVGLHDPNAWVFNRMADVYDARPPYPCALLDRLSALAGHPGARILDVGAGIGHLALPLAARGFDVHAVEPALAMLERLRAASDASGVSLQTHHATAEALPVASGTFALAIVADALHFLDAELAGREIGRVLARGGVLAVVSCELADTPYMQGVVQAMQEAAPRRPRDVAANLAQLFAVANVSEEGTERFDDAAPVDRATLERILRSISFIGPAMNAARFEAFRARIHALPGEPVWARTFTLRWARRK